NYSRAIKYKSDYAEAYANRGYARQAKGDLDGAVADYDRALELKPDLAETYVYRGCVKQLNGDIDGALADYKSFIQVNPKISLALRMLGYLQYDRHEFREALVNLLEACEPG